MTGDPQAAIAALEERKQRFPDNQPDAVERELALAREAAGRPTGPPRGRGAAQLAQRGECEHGLGGVLALIALAAAAARERLVHVLHREHAERARHAGRSCTSWIPRAASAQT